MARVPFRLTPAQVDEVWSRRRAGQAVKVLSREMRVNATTMRDLLVRTGGIAPAPRRRWELRLCLAEREEISRGLAAGLSVRVIAARLGRAPSTVSREVLANGGRRRYCAARADAARSADPGGRRSPTVAAFDPTSSISRSDRLRLLTGRCPDIGKPIWCSVAA